MTDRSDIQSFIDRLEDGFAISEEVEDGLWVLTPEDGGSPIVVTMSPPVLVLRVNVMQLPPPGDRRNELLQKLLQLNATELVHGSYGIEDTQIVLTDAMQLGNLDFSEFQASVDSITLALGSHLSTLASYQE